MTRGAEEMGKAIYLTTDRMFKRSWRTGLMEEDGDANQEGPGNI